MVNLLSKDLFFLNIGINPNVLNPVSEAALDWLQERNIFDIDVYLCVVSRLCTKYIYIYRVKGNANECPKGTC